MLPAWEVTANMADGLTWPIPAQLADGLTSKLMVEKRRAVAVTSAVVLCAAVFRIHRSTQRVGAVSDKMTRVDN
jgi:hypothetical protein